MAIKVVPYTPERVPDVAAFNQRMQDGASAWGWYEESEDGWIPPRPGRRVWREHYLAVEDDGAVRGAYALKPQDWWIRGEPVVVADWQGPVSEGAISRKHNMVGMRLIRDMLKRRPLLYSWGHGPDDAAMLQMLKSMKWLLHGTPFCLKVLAPFRFLRMNRYLRRTAGRRALLDALAFTGIGWLAHTAVGLALPLMGTLRGDGSRRARVDTEVQEVAEFGPWADALWEGCKSQYAAIGCRDAHTMNALLPQGGWPDGIRLRIQDGDRDLGWAVVMDHALEDDRRFGNLRVGSVIDCLGAPEDAPAIIAAATRFLAGRGVDIICSNQSHPAWTAAFEAADFFLLQDRRLVAASPALQEAMEPFEETKQGLHLTNLDGHGPHAL